MSVVGTLTGSDAGARTRLAAALDPSYFVPVARSVVALDAPDADLLAVYLAHDACRTISPNRHFDETFYRQANADVAEAIREGAYISGLHHYVMHGAEEGRFPNPLYAHLARDSDQEMPHLSDRKHASEVVSRYDELSAFLRFFPENDPLTLYNVLFRKLVCALAPGESFREYVWRTLDLEFYVTQAALAPETDRAGASEHYILHGYRKRLSPNPQFDERFYLAFHDDVCEAVEGGDGGLTCGYDHYYRDGQREGRIARHDLSQALEWRYRGLTQPIAIARTSELEAALCAPPVLPAERRTRTLHVVVPELNPDIFFGGYRSLIELLKHLRRHGHTISLIKTRSDFDGMHYFLHHLSDPVERELFRDVKAYSRKSTIEIGPADRFLAYSGWDALVAAKLARRTDHSRFGYLVQEYEPVFHENDSARFLLESAYHFEHFPVFNSNLLKTYFEENKLGVFRRGAADPSRYAVFEHVLTRAPRQRLGTAQLDERRVCLVYARPEHHAGRNLFEICVLALRAALQSIKLNHRWDFIGVGALSDSDAVRLSKEHHLHLLSRMSSTDYSRLLEHTHVGLSLMYAPHPSLVPFEMAVNGAVVVTNTFENRPRKFFEGISANILAAEPDFDSVTESLVAALRRADSWAEKPEPVFRDIWSKSWDEVCSGIRLRLEQEGLI